MTIIEILLTIAAVYCGGAWLLLAATSLRQRVDYEVETFHLGLCFILAIGFLGMIGG